MLMCMDIREWAKISQRKELLVAIDLSDLCLLAFFFFLSLNIQTVELKLILIEYPNFLFLCFPLRPVVLMVLTHSNVFHNKTVCL